MIGNEATRQRGNLLSYHNPSTMYGNQGFLSYMTNPCRIILFALLSLISLSTGTVQALAHSSSSKTQSIPFHAQSNVSMTRTTLNKNIGSFFLASIGLSYHSPAQALSSFSTTFLISSLFDDIQNELTSPSGGIAYLQSCIDTRDFTSILDFTKEYDIDFRKEKMGKARKTLQDKEKKEKALYYVNAVTFDLIGMNKNSRKGNENIEQVQKYFVELKNDIQGFLALEQ